MKQPTYDELLEACRRVLAALDKWHHQTGGIIWVNDPPAVHESANELLADMVTRAEQLPYSPRPGVTTISDEELRSIILANAAKPGGFCPASLTWDLASKRCGSIGETYRLDYRMRVMVMDMVMDDRVIQINSDRKVVKSPTPTAEER